MEALRDNYREFRLNNGLVVALQNLPYSKNYAGLKFNIGSLHESEEERGLAHFLEHCLTISDVETRLNGYQCNISDFSDVHAGTCSIFTQFEVSLPKRFLREQLSYLRSMFKPSLRKVDVDSERNDVLKEISGRTVNDEEYENVTRETFYRGHPEAIWTLGNPEVVEQATIEDLLKFHRKGYHPSNAELIVIGDLPQDVYQLIGKTFGDLEEGVSTRSKLSSNVSLKNRDILYKQYPGFRHENPDQSSARFLFYFHAPPRNDPDFPAYQLLTTIFGSSNNCRIQKSLRNKGYINKSITGIGSSENGGHLRIDLLGYASKMEKIVFGIFEDFRALREGYVTREEIEQAKILYEMSVADMIDNPDGRVELIRDKLLGFSVESDLENALRMTPKNLLAVAKRWIPAGIKDTNFVLNIMGPEPMDSCEQLTHIVDRFNGI